MMNRVEAEAPAVSEWPTNGARSRIEVANLTRGTD
jgi:hypothetical protein